MIARITTMKHAQMSWTVMKWVIPLLVVIIILLFLARGADWALGLDLSMGWFS